MTSNQTDAQTKTLRDKTQAAIELATKSQWEEAVSLNRELMELFPEDVETSNRLGKALMELGDWATAAEAFQRSLQLAPGNAIAKKNLERVRPLSNDAPAPRSSTQRLSPQFFIEEGGKTAQAPLQCSPTEAALASLLISAPVELLRKGNSLEVQTSQGERLGTLPAALSSRLIRLQEEGNQYQAAVARIEGHQVTVMVRETFQHPSLRGIISFPSRGGAANAARTRGMDPGVRRAEAPDRMPLSWGDEEEENVPSIRLYAVFPGQGSDGGTAGDDGDQES
jgi:hypothetical protein